MKFLYPVLPLCNSGFLSGMIRGVQKEERLEISVSVNDSKTPNVLMSRIVMPWMGPNSCKNDKRKKSDPGWISDKEIAN